MLLNSHVAHRVIGVGVVINQEPEMVTIRFPGYGDKRFLYPDAFETHLKACDHELDLAVQQDLSRKKAEIIDEQERKQQLYEVEKKQQAEEKARLAAQKRKSAAKTKPTKLATAQ